MKRSAKNETKILLERHFLKMNWEIRVVSEEEENEASLSGKISLHFSEFTLRSLKFFLEKNWIWLKLAQRFAGNRGENKNLMLIKFRKHQAIYPNSTQLDF